MKLLLAEEFASGAVDWVGTPAEELAPQGIAMLSALAQDAAGVAGWDVHLLWSRAAGASPRGAITVHEVESPDHYRELVGDWAGRMDRTLIIAPETGGRLEEVRRLVVAAGGRFLGPSAAALALCGDKLRLAGHLEQAGILTPPTWPLAEILEGDLPHGLREAERLVVKPRDGAGAGDTFRVRDRHGLGAVARYFARIGSEPIIQPYVRGRARSLAAIVSAAGCELFPLAEQTLVEQSLGDEVGFSGSGITYHGGAMTGERAELAVESLVRRVLGAVGGLAGYAGFDLILPEDDSPPVLIEINPRLTTSYLGYRKLTERNLAARLLDPEGCREPICWRGERIEWSANGLLGEV